MRAGPRQLRAAAYPARSATAARLRRGAPIRPTLLVGFLVAAALGTVPAPAVADSAPPETKASPAASGAKPRRRAPVAIGPDGRFRDNGDGTVTDSVTGLMWEKKSDDDSLHDKDLDVAWAPDGRRTTVTQWLDAINRENRTGFARHHDWRLPTRAELLSIVDGTHVDPAVSRAFNDGCVPGCDVVDASCTASAYYWSPSPHDAPVDARSTPDPAGGLPKLELALPPRAWHVHFHSGYVLIADETTSSFRVRAVRRAD